MSEEKIHVLIADDDKVSRILLREVLSRQGVEVDEAINGSEAVAAFDRIDGYDLVVADLRMPELNGVEAVRQIRQKEQEKGDLPVMIIALTALVPWAEERKEVEEHVNGFLDKPISIPHLESLVEQAALLKKARKAKAKK